MKALAITRVNLLRYFRDRSAVFNVFLLPLMIVLLLGAAAGGSSVPKLGFVASTPDGFSVELLRSLTAVEGLKVIEVAGADTAVRSVERGDLQAAVILPAGYEQTLRSGGDVAIRYVTRANPNVQGITGVVSAAVTQQATLLRTARFAQTQGVGTFDEALAVAQQARSSLPPVEVVTSTAGEPFVLAGLGQFDIYAQGMLVLFIFMTTIQGAANLIETRRLGVARRMYSTPTPVRTVIVGEMLGRFAIALVQGAFIYVGTWLIFGVGWGDPLGAVLTIVVFAAVASGAAVLLGALAGSTQLAGGISWAVGLGLAALGGAMFPLAALKLISDTVYRVAHITPHAWALEAFQTLVAERGTVADISGYLLILVGYAAVLILLATWRLRAVLVR